MSVTDAKGARLPVLTAKPMPAFAAAAVRKAIEEMKLEGTFVLCEAGEDEAAVKEILRNVSKSRQADKKGSEAESADGIDEPRETIYIPVLYTDFMKDASTDMNEWINTPEGSKRCNIPIVYSCPTPFIPLYRVTERAHKLWSDEVSDMIIRIENVADEMECGVNSLDARTILANKSTRAETAQTMADYCMLEGFIAELDDRWESSLELLDSLMQFYKMMMRNSDALMNELLAEFKSGARLESLDETKKRMERVVNSAKGIVKAAVGPELRNLVVCGHKTFDCARDLRRVGKELEKDLDWCVIKLCKGSVITIPILTRAYFRVSKNLCICTTKEHESGTHH
ncbi:hypothetical protein PFISCL1PPCAC_5417 [Pristionchus fissidentatus]|uniref:Uncharacterized protein n=1 Tax=Pristionchus fissidentatus TaxID=1538716 RepID=A0AAV5V3F6_9BILA|nr:hypothetical protein PFISCL1PPCAC_5417 [Pristionchus fissidentatus]